MTIKKNLIHFACYIWSSWETLDVTILKFRLYLSLLFLMPLMIDVEFCKCDMGIEPVSPELESFVSALCIFQKFITLKEIYVVWILPSES